MNRRGVLLFGMLIPVAGVLSGCSRDGQWAPGMVEIKWDRDVCTRCKMIISDRRFATEVCGGPDSACRKFDDIGCAVTWLAGQSWHDAATTRIFVADYEHPATQWLDARTSHFLGDRSSPMGYNYAAVSAPQTGSVDFAELGNRLAKARG